MFVKRSILVARILYNFLYFLWMMLCSVMQNFTTMYIFIVFFQLTYNVLQFNSNCIRK